MGSLGPLKEPAGRDADSSSRCPAWAWRNARGSAPAKPGPRPPHRLWRESVCWGEVPPRPPALAGSSAFNAAGRPEGGPRRTQAVCSVLAAAHSSTRGRGSKRGEGP
ncbi:hypothetical protein NDU88_001354 [Pleurodeles waltl]|uniref:Uncharacterized protein n=1 Tax=Pleurodeles waltl TaxID=8319 RepID=A0AAV7P3X0_PLEWA|nr:hypothetical protein NDU88_001354 [Pleurodeles waltl]